MTNEELSEILEKHKKWLNKEPNGCRADLRYADLRGVNLENADLRYVDLRHTSLENAILKNANLYDVNLENANLQYADLRHANLYSANLENANLNGADLLFANLRYADLKKVNLKGATLINADLRHANLRHANLEDANLYGVALLGADLSDANLCGVELIYANLYDTKLDKKEEIRKGIILDKAITGYKKCQDNTIVELIIPKGAIVFSINNYKCRTNKCIVKNIYDKNENIVEQVISYYNKDFIYHIGDKIEIKDFNLMYNVECETGIHFFRTLKEAKEYRY